MANQSQAVENIIKRARNVNIVDLENFYDKILKNVRNLECLRQLFLMLHCTRLTRRLPEDVGNALLATLCENTTSGKIVQLCVLLLKESAPYPSLEIETVMSTVKSVTALQLVPLLNSQVSDISKDSKLIEKLMKLLEDKTVAQHHPRILAFITCLASSSHFSLLNDYVKLINTFLKDVLKNTSLYQSLSTQSGGMLSKSDVGLITELDGMPSKEFFTVLSVAQNNTYDQWTHLYSFSLLKPWLLVCCDRYPASKPNYMLLSLQELVTKIVEYCLRVIEQCERQPKASRDLMIQEACLLESISLLDIACIFHPALIPSVFSVVKRIHAKLSQDFQKYPQHAVILIATVQYLLHHGDSIAYNVQGALDTLTTVVRCHYHNVSVAFEVIQFLLTNLQANCQHTAKLVIQHFPDILKILAWHPRTFLEDFVTLLTHFLSSNTAVEVFHSLLDLPCLSASLMVSLHMSCPVAEIRYAALPPQLHSVAQHFNNPRYKPMFSFMLRNTSGIGDSFNRLSEFHGILQPMANHLRVISCCDLVPGLLRCYFQAVLEKMEVMVISRLLPAVLERAGILYASPTFVVNIKHVLADALLDIFKMHPKLVVDEQDEILEHMADVQRARNQGQVSSNLVWAVGEFTSTAYHPQCMPQHIIAYYESVECIFYEVLPLLQLLKISCKLVTTMITAIVKLATRSQDLVPRAILCLTKVSQLEPQAAGSSIDDELQIVHSRANQLLLMLQMPSVASAVLSPPLDVTNGRWHKDITSLPFVLNAIPTLLKTHSCKD